MCAANEHIEGTVVRGRQLGASLGSPTANIVLDRSVAGRIRKGVYAVRVKVGEAEYGGVANVGLHPTVGESEELLAEVHLFGFSGDLYGRRLRVEPVAFLREERKFPGLEALQAAIRDDVSRAKRILANESHSE